MRVTAPTIAIISGGHHPEQARFLSSTEKSRLLSSLAVSLADVVERVPAGEPATCMRHDGSVVAAPGVTLRESSGETISERRRS